MFIWLRRDHIVRISILAILLDELTNPTSFCSCEENRQIHWKKGKWKGIRRNSTFKEEKSKIQEFKDVLMLRNSDRVVVEGKMDREKYNTYAV